MCRSKADGGRRCNGRKAPQSSAAGDVTGVSASPELSGHLRRIRTAVLQAAEKQSGDLLDAAVDAGPGAPAAAVVPTDVADQVADAITATLEAHGCLRGRQQNHLLCGALAATAQAMKAGEDLARTAVTDGIAAALVVAGIPRLAADLAGRAAADTLMRQTPVRHWEDVRRAVELLAMATCPNVADHPDVVEYCLQPLASDMLSSAIQEELAESMPGERSLSAG